MTHLRQRESQWQRSVGGGGLPTKMAIFGMTLNESIFLHSEHGYVIVRSVNYERKS